MSNIIADAFIFDGQGTAACTSPQTESIALRDAELPLGNALLRACYQAFIQEFSSLPDEEKTRAGIDISAFQSPHSLLEVPARFRAHGIIANTNLYLIQLLRYLANVDPSSIGGASQTSPSMIGFSTGMLAATVVATSASIPSFFVNAIDTFKLAFWLGLRAQLYATSVDGGEPVNSPWSMVLFGSTREEVQAAVDAYNSANAKFSVYVTAATNDTCISVSGHPDALALFKESYLPESSTSQRYAAIFTLYHSSAMEEVKVEVMQDVQRRGIHSPTFDDLKKPLVSPVDASIVCASTGTTLLDTVVGFTLVHPVNFDLVIASIASNPAFTQRAFRVVNIGPGTGLSRSMTRALQGVQVSVTDWSSSAGANSTTSPHALYESAPRREPIAIVGMAVNLPGAKDVDGLWNVLETGLNTCSEIPKERFDVSKYNDAPNGSKRSLKTKYGNFIENPGEFDNVFFRMSPREARSMDPQQRVLLQVAYHALEDAGYVPNATPSYNPDTFATFVGVATNDYVQNLRNDVDVYYSTGTLPAFLCGKLSYAFGFSGPSQVIDTACSSSCIAIYQACRALTNRDCNAAIAGGVNVMASPDMYIGLDRAHFLSATGQCKPWDSSADGYCRSEGSGMFVLKRLSDALAENDNILGVIRGVETNQSAHAESITHPHVPTQISLFKKLIAASGVDPKQIGVIEAHGTGTQAGDPTELESIRAVFSRGRAPENPLHVTSVKANIGHAEAASGAAGLAKLVLMLQKRTIPAVISLKKLNPRIPPLEEDGTVIDTELTAWDAPQDGRPRMALLNNFGAAGSNGAIIVEEAPVQPLPKTTDLAALVLGMSCDSEAAVEQLRESYLKYLNTAVDDERALLNFVYTATARRRLHRYRLAVSGKSKEDLANALKNAPPVEVSDKVAGKVLFAFSGQGGQYVGMGAGLYKASPLFRGLVDECEAKLVAWGYPGVLSIINPPSDAPSASEDDFQAFQCAVFVLEYALAELWMSWGVLPGAVAGHSLGEYAALVVAGVMTADDALKMVAERARLMKAKCAAGTTGMMAVKMGSDKMTETLKAKYDSLTIACYNSNADCVVAGNREQLDILQTELKADGIKCLRLNVEHGYHTAAMDPIVDDLRQLGSQIKLSAPSIPILSDVHGVVVAAGDSSVFNAEYFARHCGEAVRFEQGIEDLAARPEFSDVTAWIEIGPHPTTLPMLRSPGQKAKLLPSLRKDSKDLEVLCATLSTLYCTTAAVDWLKVYGELAPGARIATLPAYPFAKTNFWVAFQEDQPKASTSISAPVSRGSTRFTLLSSCVSLPEPGSKDAAVFETPIDRLSHLIKGHVVAGYALCPASIYHEMASAAAQHTLEHLGRVDGENVLDLSEIVYSNPLVYSAEVQRTVKVEIVVFGGDEKHSGKFTVSSYIGSASGESQAHCSGFFAVRSKSYTASKLSLSKTMVERREQAVRVESGGKAPETFFTHTAYNIVFSRVVAYSPDYHTMKYITMDKNGIDAYAVVQLPERSRAGAFVAHPIFMDTLLHAAGFVINCNAGDNEAFICSQVDKVQAVPDMISTAATYGVYCSIGFMSDTLAIADAYAIELDGAERRVVAHMKRMRFRKLRKNGFTSLLAMAAQGTGHASTSTQGASRRSEKMPASPAKAPARAARAPKADTQGDILRIISETCGVELGDVKMQSRLSDLGIDSLMSIELAARIQALLPSAHVDSHDLGEYNHVGDLVLAFTQQAGSSSSSSSSESDSDSDSDGTLQENNEAVLTPQTTLKSAASSVLKTLVEVMSSILGVSSGELSHDQDLERMGLDSLTSIEARHALQSSLNVTLSEDVFTKCKTIGALGRAIQHI